MNFRECFSEVEQEDEERKSIAQQILQNTDFLRRVIVPVEEHGEVTFSFATDTRLKTTPGGCLQGIGKKQCNWWCAACGGQYDWGNRNGILVIQDSLDCRAAQVTRAHSPPHEVLENLVDALKLCGEISRRDVTVWWTCWLRASKNEADSR